MSFYIIETCVVAVFNTFLLRCKTIYNKIENSITQTTNYFQICVHISGGASIEGARAPPLLKF